MSAPPIGMMSVTPSAQATITMSQKAARLSPPMSQTSSNKSSTPRPMLRT
jgi:hypothetical protein